MTDVPRFHRFVDWEAAVVDPILAYRREHDPEKLALSASTVRAVTDSLTGPSICSGERATIVTGWLHPRHGFRLSMRALEKVNHGYRFAVTRSTRPELGRAGRLLRLGYRVEARSSDPNLPFVFAATTWTGELFDLPASNSDAEFRKSFFSRSVPLASLTPDGGGPMGYIDDVTDAPVPDDARPETWLAAIVHRHPAALRELVDSGSGRFIADDAARLSATYAQNARWADKFALSAQGLAGTFQSDLVPLVALTPNPNRIDAPGAMPLPVLVADGRLIRATPGTTLMPVPSDRWLSYSHAAVQDGGTVNTDDGLIVYESSAHPATDFVSGQFSTVFGSYAHPDAVLLRRRPPTETPIDEAILLSGRNDSNWFHWLVEYLPRVLQAEGVIDPSVPVLLTPRIPVTGLEALKQLSARAILVSDPGRSQLVHRLHVIAPPVQVLDSTKVAWDDGLSVNRDALVALRTAWGVNEGPPQNRRVFLRRTSKHRGLLNETELAEIARAAGLEVVDPSGLGFSAQFELFRSAELLVGASGAVMANYLMMRDGSRILAMTSEGLSDFVLPATLASVAGASFAYLTGRPTRTLDEAPDRNQWLIHSNFIVDPVDFENALRAELRALA
jgi:capsular polysaccharide biosynthesis protein